MDSKIASVARERLAVDFDATTASRSPGEERAGGVGRLRPVDIVARVDRLEQFATAT